MVEPTRYPIRCPKCGHEQVVELYNVVNVFLNPKLKEDLLANRLNVVTCEGCSAVFRVDLPLVYSDPSRHLLIYWVPLAEKDQQQGELEFQEVLRELQQAMPADVDTPPVSLVFDRYELVERIFLAEADMDVRVIEYIKYLIYLRNRAKVDPKYKILLFDAEDSTDQMLCFVVQDAATRKLESLLQYDRKTYQALCDIFDRDDQTPSLMELFPGPHFSARALFLRGEAPPEPPVPEHPPAEPQS